MVALTIPVLSRAVQFCGALARTMSIRKAVRHDEPCWCPEYRGRILLGFKKKILTWKTYRIMNGSLTHNFSLTLDRAKPPRR